MQQKISERLEKLGKSLSQLGKDKGVAEPGYILFSNVKGYQQTPPLKSIKAAHNLWATLNYVFVLVDVNSWSGKLNVGRYIDLITKHLFDSARILQEGEIVIDETTDSLATLFQDFFSDADKLDKPTRDNLDWALGGNSVEIFKRLSKTFDMAKHRYELNQKLEQQLTDLEKQITDSLTPPDPEQLDRFRQSALNLLPGNQLLNLTSNVDETFTRYYETYLQSISILDTECFESYDKLHPFRDKFIEERERCTKFINSIIQRVNDLPGKLAAQQKKIEEEEKAKQAESSEFLSQQPVQEEKEEKVGFPEILSLQEQIALLKNQLTTAENEWQSLKEKQTLLETERNQLTQSLSESKNLGEEQEELTKQLSKVTQLKTEIEGDKLNNNVITDESTLALLNADEETLKIYLQQQSEKTGWVAWGWGAPRRTWQWATGTTTSLPYLEQKAQFTQTLTEKQTDLAEAIKQRKANEAELTNLNSELAALTTRVEKQEALQADLKEKQTKLQVTLQQKQEEYNAKQSLADSIRTALIITREDSSIPSTSSEPDLAEITESQQGESSILNVKSQQTETEDSSPQAKKKAKLDAAETYLDSLLESSDASRENFKFILIIAALATYLKALVDYHTELDIKASLKQLKTEVKSVFAAPPLIPGTFFQSKSTDKADSKSENENVQQPLSNQTSPRNPK